LALLYISGIANSREKAAMWRLLDVTFANHGLKDGVGQSCPITVRTPPQKWQYASLSSESEFEGGREELAVVKIAAVVHAGQIGIGLISPRDISRYIVPERILSRSPSAQEVTFLVSKKEQFRVCVRTGDADHAGHVQILRVSWTDDRKLVKQAGVAAFCHWYYTVNLGDGVVIRATVDDEPSWTKANAVSRAIFSFLLAKYVGPISGAKVLDVACSAGHFSFLFASMGARVRGFDHDEKAIEQARFIADQLSKEWTGSTSFAVGDLETFRAEEQYDLVFCSGLFYHLRDPLGGAQNLKNLTKRWLLIQSCVSDRRDPVFELSDPARWPFCADWEYCLVPSASMVQTVFQRLGLRLRASFQLNDFAVDEKATSVKIRPAPESEPDQIARLDGPIYLVLEKVQ
jgi:SAM-dependent methyltransferase